MPATRYTTKRAGGALKGKPAAKSRKAAVDYPRGAYEAVVEGVSMADHLSEACREMLRATIATTLCLPVEERGEVHAMVVQMVEETLSEVAGRLRASVDLSVEAVAAAEAGKGELADKLTEAEAAAAAKAEAMGGKQAALAEVAQTLAAARSTVAEKEKEQKSAAAPLAQAHAELKHVEGVIADEFKALVEGTWEKPAESKKLHDAIAAVLKKLTVEESLMAALPGAIMKKPEARGGFDLVLLQECEQKLQAKVAELKAQAEVLLASERECAVAADEARHSLESVNKASEAASQALVTAQVAHKEAAVALEAAKSALSGGEAASVEAAAHRARSQAALEVFESQSLQGFKMLCSRTSKAPQVEPAPAAAGPAGADIALLEA